MTYLNQPAQFVTKATAKAAASLINGPQIKKKEIVGGNIKITWDNNTTSLAPIWWFQRMSESE